MLYRLRCRFHFVFAAYFLTLTFPAGPCTSCGHHRPGLIVADLVTPGVVFFGSRWWAHSGNVVTLLQGHPSSSIAFSGRGSSSRARAIRHLGHPVGRAQQDAHRESCSRRPLGMLLRWRSGVSDQSCLFRPDGAFRRGQCSACCTCFPRGYSAEPRLNDAQKTWA